MATGTGSAFSAAGSARRQAEVLGCGLPRSARQAAYQDLPEQEGRRSMAGRDPRRSQPRRAHARAVIDHGRRGRPAMAGARAGRGPGARHAAGLRSGRARCTSSPTLGTAKLASSRPRCWTAGATACSPAASIAPRSPAARARKVLAILKSILSAAQRRGLVAAERGPLGQGRSPQARRPRSWSSASTFPARPRSAACSPPSTRPGGASPAADRHRDLHRHALVGAARPGLGRRRSRRRRTITVRQRADDWGTIGMPKSAAGQREIPLSPTVVNTLREWRLACPKGELDLVFPNAAGKVQPLTNIGSGCGVPCKRRPGWSMPRASRYSTSTPCATSPPPPGSRPVSRPKRLQAMLGHSSITMTYDPYGHLFPSAEDDQDKMARVAAGLVAL